LNTEDEALDTKSRVPLAIGAQATMPLALLATSVTWIFADLKSATSIFMSSRLKKRKLISLQIMITDEIDRSSSFPYKMNNINKCSISVTDESSEIHCSIVSQNEILRIIKHICVIKYFPQQSKEIS